MGQLWGLPAEAPEGAEDVVVVRSEDILPECPICLTADGQTLVPCRVCIYAICGRCIASLVQPRCPFCRTAGPRHLPGLRPVGSLAVATNPWRRFHGHRSYIYVHGPGLRPLPFRSLPAVPIRGLIPRLVDGLAIPENSDSESELEVIADRAPRELARANPLRQAAPESSESATVRNEM